MEEHIKAKIDKLVDVFLDQLLSSDSDAGWHNAGLHQACIESIRSTGGDKDMRMIMEMRFVRHKHELYPQAATILAHMKQNYRLALLYHRYADDRVDPDTGKRINESDIARHISTDLIPCTPDQYRHNKKMAYKQARANLIMLMDYDHSKKTARREVA